MEPQIYYLKVFIEACWTASIIPFSSEATLISLKLFEKGDMHIAVLCAILGGTLGHTFNLCVGRFILGFHKRKQLRIPEEGYNKISYYFQKYGVWVLLFSWTSLGKILVLIAGLLNIRFRIAIPLIMLGLIYNYSEYVM